MVFFQRDADELAVWVSVGVFVVSYISAFCSKYAVVPTEFTVLAGEPCCAALSEYNVAGDYVFALSCGVSYVVGEYWGRGCMYLHSSLLLIAFPVRLWRRWLVLETDARRIVRRGGLWVRRVPWCHWRLEELQGRISMVRLSLKMPILMRALALVFVGAAWRLWCRVVMRPTS